METTTLSSGTDAQRRFHRRRQSPFSRTAPLSPMLERRQIERMNASEIAAELAQAFNQHCTRQGPSVSPEVYGQVVHARQCGSQIPSFRG